MTRISGSNAGAGGATGADLTVTDDGTYYVVIHAGTGTRLFKILKSTLEIEMAAGFNTDQTI